MNIESIAAAVAILSVLGTFLIQLIKVIANQAVEAKLKQFQVEVKEFELETDKRFKDVYKEFEDVEKEFIKQSDRSGRIERRLAVLQTKTTGNTDTFGST